MRQTLTILSVLLLPLMSACGPKASVRDTPDDEPAVATAPTSPPEIDRDTATIFMKQWVNSTAVYEPEYPEVAKPPYDMERPYAPAVVIAQVVDGELKVERLAATPAAQWVNRTVDVFGYGTEPTSCTGNLCNFIDSLALTFIRMGGRWLVSGVLAPQHITPHSAETLAAFRAAVAASDPTVAPPEDE